MIRLCGSVKLFLRLLLRLPVFALVGLSAPRVALHSRLAAAGFVGLALPSLQTFLRRPDRRQTVLPPAQLLRQLVPSKILPEPRVLLRVHRTRPVQQRLDLRLQTTLLLKHPSVTHRLALGGVRPHLRPVDRQLAEVRHAGLRRQPHHFHEQPLEIPKMTPPKLADRPVTRKVPRRQNPERHIFLQLARQTPGRNHPRRVPVNQHLQHHPRLVRRLATAVALVGRVKHRQIQPVHQVTHMVRQMTSRQPIPHIRRQQQPLIRMVRAQSRRHPRILNNPMPVLSHPSFYGAGS